jgi:RES domain-containing protein
MSIHPESERLKAGLRRCLELAGLWDGSMFRFASVRFANRVDLMSGEGARIDGGRWNPPGKFACVYGSLTADVAQEEAFASIDRYGIARDQIGPRVQVAVRLRLQAVLDLTEQTALSRLKLTKVRLARCDWQSAQERGQEALTQCIGRLAWEERLEALIVPSRRVTGASNIVLFPGRRRRGSSWRIQGARDLPRRSEP